MSKVKIDQKEYEMFTRWKMGNSNVSNLRKSNKLLNWFLILIVILTLWFVFGKDSFLDFFGSIFGLLSKK